MSQRSNLSDEELKERILAALGSVNYPGFDKDILSLDMVEEFTVDGAAIEVKMKRLNADDATRQALAQAVAGALRPLGLSARLAFEGEGAKQPHGGGHELPPKRPIEGVKYLIPVASGKGGVGKSTAAVNLAVALAKKGHAVGLLDLDVYGPSAPTMFGLEGQHKVGPNNRLMPAEKFGVKVVTVGLLMEKGAPLIWRGPLVSRLVKQLFYDVDWGALDYLIMDLPPGTGDVQLSLVQSVPITGALVITTPQDVALKDAERAVNMFNQTGTPVLGIVENMSYFICPHCKGESHIFGTGGGKREAARAGVPLLGEIPLEGTIVETGDKGDPIAAGDNAIAAIFGELAERLHTAVTAAR